MDPKSSFRACNQPPSRWLTFRYMKSCSLPATFPDIIILEVELPKIKTTIKPPMNNHPIILTTMTS